MATKRVNISIDGELHKNGRALALARNIDFSQLLSELLREELRKEGQIRFGDDKTAEADKRIDK